MCDLISRCRGTMVPASASARRSTPASRDPALGGHEGRGRWRWSPTGRTVRNRIRSYRRRGCHPTHRPRPPPRPPPPPRAPPRRGELSVGESLGTPAPRARCLPPLHAKRRRGGSRWNAWGTRTEVRSRSRFRDGLRYEANPKANRAILFKRDRFRFLSKKKNDCD